MQITVKTENRNYGHAKAIYLGKVKVGVVYKNILCSRGEPDKYVCRVSLPMVKEQPNFATEEEAIERAKKVIKQWAKAVGFTVED